MLWDRFGGQFQFGRDVYGNLKCAITFELPQTVSEKHKVGKYKDMPWIFHAEHTVITTSKTEEITEYIEALEASRKRILEWIKLLKRVHNNQLHPT